jgi:hypothetical protein
MTEVDERDGLLLLETINPNDMTEEDLVELATTLNREIGIPIGIGYEDQFGAGVSWHEVLYLWLPNHEFVKDEIWVTALGTVLENLRQRFKRKGNERRPKSLIVRDPSTGEVVATYLIEEVGSKVKEEEPDQSPRRRPPLRRKIQ